MICWNADLTNSAVLISFLKPTVNILSDEFNYERHPGQRDLDRIFFPFKGAINNGFELNT